MGLESFIHFQSSSTKINFTPGNEIIKNKLFPLLALANLLRDICVISSSRIVCSIELMSAAYGTSFYIFPLDV